ncbi:hypothetical protein [Acholeplasma laidlawii]|uniref:hypothetical protein n=1 Tax=Acholeplasma laidlawii TaxID=2148 RepID=UPI0025405BCD|nr:hypothetical protein QOL21_07585 [Acholeplasma laidlawii]
MRDAKSIIVGIILFILIATGVFSVLIELTGEFIKLTLWIFQLSLTDFGLSPAIEIIVKSLTFILSYALVGIIFSAIRLFNSDVMKYAYFVVSTMIGFALSALIMFLQEHIIIISWSILGITIITIFTILFLVKKRNTLKG